MRQTRWPALPLSSLALAALAGACSAQPGATATGDDGATPVIAFASSFDGFTGWTSKTTDDAVAEGSTHVAGLRTVYINHLPSADATAFPLGTIIVKVTETDGKIFAREKRGGGYNATGAVDWEWFELEETAQSETVIIWRGVGPPIGEQYGGDPNGGCNSCHGAAGANDYVLSPWLRLGGVADAALVPTSDDAGDDDASGDVGGESGGLDATADDVSPPAADGGQPPPDGGAT